MENYKYNKKTILHSIIVSFAWEISLCTPAGAYALIEPHNPRTTPTKAMMNIASAILGVVYILLFS